MQLQSYLFVIAGVTAICSYDQLIGWDGISLTILSRLSMNHDFPDLCLQRSWDYRYEPSVKFYDNQNLHDYFA
jgi:hypothetical protein